MTSAKCTDSREAQPALVTAVFEHDSPVKDSPWLTPRAAYLHVPFCAHHCGYCDFAVVAGRDDLFGAYVEGLIREIATLQAPQAVDTVFIGGGTPTYLPAPELAQLLAAIHRWLPLAANGEWSIESTPESLDAEKIELMARAGVNRVSIGGQSFRDSLLQTLDRRHVAEQIEPAIARVGRRIGDVSLDLIFGVPNQSLEAWMGDVARAAELGVPHLSCYGLTYEKGTPLWRDRQANRVEPVEEELEREMFLAAHDELTARGYEHYEISNYALPGHRCRHNEVYWANHAYFGFGLGAARYVNGRREVNARRIEDYLSRVSQDRSPAMQREELDREDRARETLTVQLRRSEGVNRQSFGEQTGITIDEIAGSALPPLIELRLLLDDGENIRFTREGWCVADTVLTELWAAERSPRIDLRMATG